MQIKGAEEIAAEGNPQITPLPTLTYPPKPTEKFRSKDGWSRFSKIKKGGDRLCSHNGWKQQKMHVNTSLVD